MYFQVFFGPCYLRKNPLDKLQAESQKEAAATCEKAKEAAEAVKEEAKEVRKTSEFVRDMASSTAKNVCVNVKNHMYSSKCYKKLLLKFH